jgi:signal transduction histidine kinase
LKSCTNDIKSLSEEKKISVILDNNSKNMCVYFDRHRISQAVTNLLSNSIKFSQPGTEITVAFEHKNRNEINIPEYIQSTSLDTRSFAVISIRDHGFGIDKNNLAKVFDRFYQVENANNRKIQGTGLGLTIVKNIVEFHSGLIWAESDGIGKGSTFMILLPAENADSTVHQEQPLNA